MDLKKELQPYSNEYIQLQKKVKWYEKRFGPYIEKKGLHNWKNLFRKPTTYEWIILLMMITALFLFWAYRQDLTACQETYETYIKENCLIPINFTLDYGGLGEEDDKMEKG